jgi:hypothetical protein
LGGLSISLVGAAAAGVVVLARICGILFRFFLKEIPQFCAGPAGCHGWYAVSYLAHRSELGGLMRRW